MSKTDNYVSKIYALCKHLSLSISEIALILNVKRDTVKKWMSGGSPTKHNKLRLDDLFIYCEMWKSYGVADIDLRIYKKYDLFDCSLLDALQEEPYDMYKILAFFTIIASEKKDEARERRLDLEKSRGFKPVSKEEGWRRIKRFVRSIS